MFSDRTQTARKTAAMTLEIFVSRQMSNISGF